MTLWLATTNDGKLKEFKNLLMSKPVELKTLKDLGTYSSPKEDGDSFEANSLIKARACRAVVKDGWVVAEDSGLVCDGLNGMPGIYSARYAGDNARDSENTSKVLKMLKLRSTNRDARFVCCLTAISPEGEVHVFNGTIEGQISPTIKGSAGFGYDPIFIPQGETQTMAELGAGYKAKNSHRSKAIKQFIAQVLEA
ncbi:MAG: non-canonical purine NTP pyrophosphatase, RdgB/HAM1 family [Bdellovibrionaceae bacterium]|nr:non-canonical purine NTP pyrophosphatase, RdgB/HAM1 family [Pseudobdellovibrionaceae bacterium]